MASGHLAIRVWARAWGAAVVDRELAGQNGNSARTDCRIAARQEFHGGAMIELQLFEIALVLVCLNHVASVIVNANHSLI